MFPKTRALLTHEEVLSLLAKHIPVTANTEIETMRYAVHSLATKPHAPASLKPELLELGITDFEAVQLINRPPKKLVDLYVVVEEIEERLGEAELEAVLKKLSPFAE
ncbi:hypothetical protein NEDG_00153 [Nematocida displodere]|uniref:DNA-directed RNA polymerase III subunit RPC9 n=1 Tax=Nematocida displodere TaxID=1805483 RepID=A0A177EIG9_9MICR|nr:hypothetical protein NEDG_00153 [Nematocida displodere]